MTKILMIIAAPSGAGKSTISLGLIDKHNTNFSHIAALLPIDMPNFKRTDAKLMLGEPERDTVFIIEAVIKNNHSDPYPKGWEKIKNLVDKSDYICVLTLKVGKKDIAKRYFQRIFKRRKMKDIHSLQIARFFHIRKYIRAFIYYFSNNIPNAYKRWDNISKELRTINKNTYYYDIENIKDIYTVHQIK